MNPIQLYCVQVLKVGWAVSQVTTYNRFNLNIYLVLVKQGQQKNIKFCGKMKKIPKQSLQIVSKYFDKIAK